ncbi:hypothetical protein R6258_07710 [Halomonas sp. HP20-15]|uniref:hypothetical protein n=1 Tax=Halomonas sp. HP20-15 TaxID=3085901 RepID=UPI00298250F8|nr:hypothetical protein [Halomonas sp. HP20-15]MDW5376805.1 hypothetical protein [Halomonas sp. HP20-15]
MNWMTESDRGAAGIVMGMAVLLLAMLALLVWAVIVGPTDHQVRQAAQTDYCQAVGQWNDMAARGVPAAQRFGHPDYDDRASDCTDYTSASGEQLASW